MAAKVQRLVMLCGLATILAGPAAAHDKHREAGAHEHGRGTLNIAVEGNRVSLELEAPASDIVGFEHAAKTTKEKAAVEKAKALLASPHALFVFPASAACRVAEANIDFGATEPGKGDTDKGGGHADVEAQYVLDCAAPANITAIEFGYFGAFAGAQRLDVNVATGRAQSKFQVTRSRPSLSLAGMM
jgi:hypothetical protein